MASIPEATDAHEQWWQDDRVVLQHFTSPGARDELAHGNVSSVDWVLVPTIGTAVHVVRTAQCLRDGLRASAGPRDGVTPLPRETLCWGEARERWSRVPGAWMLPAGGMS